MKFKDYLLQQIKKHPSIMPQDIAKLCYQAAYGAEHLLSDISAAKRYFDAEFDAVEACEGELYEAISDKVCRVNLAVWKKRALSRERLFEAFVSSSKVGGERGDIVSYLDSATELVRNGKCSFSPDEWESFLSEYKGKGMPAVHHSDKYRKAEKPSYRVIRAELLRELLK